MLRIAHLTDLHLPAHSDEAVAGRHADHALENILLAVLALDPDLLLLTGDLADSGDEKAYLRLKQRLRSLKCPIFAVPGNHDHPIHMRQILGAHAWGAGRVMDLKGWRIIGLSSYWRGHAKGRLDIIQWRWLSQQLQLSSSPTLLAVHHPPIAIGSAWLDAMGLDNAWALKSLLRRHPQVRAVLFGHAHQNIEMYQGRCRFLGTPSTLRQFLPRSDHFDWSDEPGGWRWLTLFRSGRIQSQVMLESI